MYEMTVRLRFSDMGFDGKLRPYVLPKIFQDCSIEHSEAVGVGMSYLSSRNLAWLLTSWQIDIERLPEYHEEVTIQTWPYEFRTAFGYRNYDMIDKNGNILVKAYALWLHTDTSEMKPVHVTDEEAESYGLEPKLDMEYAPRKIDLPKEMEAVDRLRVTSRYADMYLHMNNAVYVDVASDYLPEHVSIKRIRVDYRKQLKIGDVTVIRKKIEGNVCYIAFCDETGVLHVGTEFVISNINNT